MDFEQAGNNKGIFNRLGPANNGRSQYQHQYQQPHHSQTQSKVCQFWLSGRCNRFHCKFLHSDPTASSSSAVASSSSSRGAAFPSSKRPYGSGAGVADEGFSTRKNPNFHNTWGRDGNTNGVRGPGVGGIVRKIEKLCNYWVEGHCKFGEKCKYLHSWSVGDGFSLLTTLEGHQKAVTAISLPSGSDKLYTGGKDETMRMWDCQSGQCAGVCNLGGEVGCIICEGPFIFVGLVNMVKVLNPQTGSDQNLSGPVGQVYALAVGNGLLFAATQDAKILAWKFNPGSNSFEPAAALEGHSGSVVTLCVGANRLFSGSMDNTIKVWNLETLECLQTMTDHTSVVMSVLCWDQFLLSCSLDKTIKIWVATESGKLEVTYTHTEQYGLITLSGVVDSEAKPVLLCACNDDHNTVRMYDLPSFMERGKIFAKQEVRAIQSYNGGLFFTGDGTGQVRVWKWSPPEASATSTA